MPRTVTVQMANATGAQGTRPGYFIEVVGAVTYRWCTRGDTTWNSLVWVGMPVSVSGVGSGGNGANVPTVNVADPSGAAIADALSGAIKDASVRIWVMDAGALAASDPALVFVGAVSSIRGNMSDMSVTITLTVAKASALFSPRMTYGPSAGISNVMPRGTLLSIGGKEYKVDRR